ncbi:MAG: hypothetical protein ACRD3B_03315 [Candidatus Sulfotelmatobacter sp.]
MPWNGMAIRRRTNTAGERDWVIGEFSNWVIEKPFPASFEIAPLLPLTTLLSANIQIKGASEIFARAKSLVVRQFEFWPTHRGVIPKPRDFTSGARNLAWTKPEAMRAGSFAPPEKRLR